MAVMPARTEITVISARRLSEMRRARGNGGIEDLKREYMTPSKTRIYERDYLTMDAMNDKLKKRITYCVKADNWNWIVMCGTEVVDIFISSDWPCPNYAGCCCSVSNDTERYDKELGKITCPYKDSCCNQVLEKIKGNNDPVGNSMGKSCIELIHKDMAEENQFLKKQNEEIITATRHLKESLDTLKKESQSEIDKWQIRFYNLQYKNVLKIIEKKPDGD